MIFVRDIQLAVADAFEINPAEMVSARRSQPQAFVRQIAMYLSRELTPYSLPTIGRLFGKRDHTTIMHGIKVVEKHMAENDEDREKIAAVQARILAGGSPWLQGILSRIDDPFVRKTIIMGWWERQEITPEQTARLLHDNALETA